MTEQRSDEDRDATGESRDDRGRLMGVRVDGAWFYRYVPSLVQQLRDANGELVESLERATEARDAFKDERNSAVAEVRSLRGVVQAVTGFCQRQATAAHARGDGGTERRFQDALIVAERALAAAADAPQPADEPPTCRVRWVWPAIAEQPSEPSMCEHGATGPHRIPSPWHDDPSEPRVYHCPGPSPAVLPEKEASE